MTEKDNLLRNSTSEKINTKRPRRHGDEELAERIYNSYKKNIIGNALPVYSMKNDYVSFYISLKPDFDFTDDEVYRMIKNPNNPVTAVIIAINLLQETKYVDMIKSDFDILSGKRSKGQIDFLGLS